MSNVKTTALLSSLQQGYQDVTSIPLEKLVAVIFYCNEQYRAGTPVATDDFYDHTLIEELVRREPTHPFLDAVEPEVILPGTKTVPLPKRMLSIQKAYKLEDVRKWVESMETAALAVLGTSQIFFRGTPKLDGFAAYNEGDKLYTRGDGRNGTDITHVLHRGLRVRGQWNLGPGEIVVNKEYFDSYLNDKYENTRNVIASVIKEGDLASEISLAIAEEAISFVPFVCLGQEMLSRDELLQNLEAVFDIVAQKCRYETDGLVIEILPQEIKDTVGSTNHHHRWQIAYKRNTEYHDVAVVNVIPQTAKTGRITPVAELVPTKISGVTVSRATCHHYGYVIKERIAPGAVVKVCRSGQVIPKIEEVVLRSDAGLVPTHCPSCGASAELEGDNLMCTNTSTCPAQIERTIGYFFKTLGNCDGFGPKVIEQICATGITNVADIFAWEAEDFRSVGFGPGISSNLFAELQASRWRPIEDWRFLAAFSIPSVGIGGCERLLKHHRLEDVFALTASQITEIDGFAEKTASILVDSLKRIKPEFDELMRKRFNLIETPRGVSVDSPIAGKTIVFTGAMQQGSRDDMKKQAKALGAIVTDSVTGKTDFLVCGDKVGESKTKAAAAKGVTVISETEYLKMLE